MKIAILNKSTKVNGVKLNVITDLNRILNADVDRVARYLHNYENYKKNGYKNILRWPEGIDPELGFDSQKGLIIQMVTKEVKSKYSLYESFGTEISLNFNLMKRACFDQISSKLYGFKVGGNYDILPTLYGTISSPFDTLSDKPAFFRLPYFDKSWNNSFLKESGRTIIENITHELYAHTLTSNLRSGTLIDDRTNIGTKIGHKERLMDLLTRTILVRSGLMDRQKVVMQKSFIGSGGEIAKLVDNIYYANKDQDENKLRYDGNVGNLFEKVLNEIKKI